MATTLADIRATVEEELQDSINNEKIIHWCNVAQADFMLRIKIPKSTTLAINTTALSYTTLPSDIFEFRRFRYQSDLDNKRNREVYPVYEFYNGIFEVPVPFPKADTLLIDYYSFLKNFTTITDLIDLADRFKPLYTSYIKAMYYTLTETQNKMPGRGRYVPWQMMYQDVMSVYQTTKKQVADFYIIATGVEKPSESGW